MRYQPSKSKNVPEHRFHQNLLKRYNTWVDNGKPDLAATELYTIEQEAFRTHSKNSKDEFTTSLSVSSPNESGSATLISYQVEQVKSYSTLYQIMNQVILFKLNILKSIIQQTQNHYQLRTFILLFLKVVSATFLLI